jgi:hypothetical protein
MAQYVDVIVSDLKVTMIRSESAIELVDYTTQRSPRWTRRGICSPQCLV